MSLILLLVGLLASCGHGPQPEKPGPTAELAAVLGGQEAQGYERALTVRDFSFPRDHGAHPSFRNEWWYFTGNLRNGGGRRFGFQLTFFRVGLNPTQSPRYSGWATNQAFMAHFAITDVDQKTFHGTERLSRGAAGLAGAQLDPLTIWLEDWRISARSGNDFPWELAAQQDDISISLLVRPLKDVVLQGDRGLSQKSSEPGNASYYYSIPRLQAEGYLDLGKQHHVVSGLAWLDREWSTSALGEGQIGWDWFALQMDDGSDIMFYQLRRDDGSVDEHSQGVIVGPDGRVTRLGRDDVTFAVLGSWLSPSGASYPVRWKAAITPLGKTLIVETVLEGQEQNLSVRYWEGAVDVLDERRERLGQGYMELTAYRPE